MVKVNDRVSIRGANIGFRNFSGKGGQYNPEGNRNFCIFLNEEIAMELKEKGWNVRFKEPYEEGDPPTAYIQVAVSFDHIPPKVVLVTTRKKTPLNAKTIDMLDWAEISNVDVTIRPYNWSVGGKTGVKAYVKTLYVTVIEDDFESDYEDKELSIEEPF